MHAGIGPDLVEQFEFRFPSEELLRRVPREPRGGDLLSELRDGGNDGVDVTDQLAQQVGWCRDELFTRITSAQSQIFKMRRLGGSGFFSSIHEQRHAVMQCQVSFPLCIGDAKTFSQFGFQFRVTIKETGFFPKKGRHRLVVRLRAWKFTHKMHNSGTFADKLCQLLDGVFCRLGEIFLNDHLATGTAKIVSQITTELRKRSCRFFEFVGHT